MSIISSGAIKETPIRKLVTRNVWSVPSLTGGRWCFIFFIQVFSLCTWPDCQLPDRPFAFLMVSFYLVNTRSVEWVIVYGDRYANEHSISRSSYHWDENSEHRQLKLTSRESKGLINLTLFRFHEMALRALWIKYQTDGHQFTGVFLIAQYFG